MDDDRRADQRAEDRALERREDAALVERARSEDPDAFGQLYDRWFARVNDLAYRVTNDSAAAGDVAQDAFLSAWQKLDTLQDPEAFGGWLLRITRNAALDRRRKDERARPHDSEAMAVIEAAGPSPANAPAGFRVEDRTTAAEDPSRAAEDGELAALLWESAAALGERDAEVLDLMLRHGMAPAEIGEVVGLNRNAANQAVHRARNRLKAAVEARVLWRSGEPVCTGLAGALETAKVTRFGPEAMRVTTRHAEKCEECQARRQTKLEPSRMFAAVPMVVASMFLKDKVAHALSESGVPMQGSSSLGGDTTPPDTPKPRGRRVLRRVLTGVGVLVGALVILVVLAEAVDEVTDTETTARRSAVTTTSGPGGDDPTTTSGVPLDVSTTLGTTVTTTAVFVPPPPTAPPTVPESGTGFVRVAKQGPSPRSALVSVTWGSSGGTSVAISGNGWRGSTAPSGSTTVCATGGPPVPSCVSPPMTAFYTIVVRGSQGQVLFEQTAPVAVGG